MNCQHCRGTLTRRTHTHTTMVGARKVLDGSSMAMVCDGCGAVDLSFEEAEAYELRAARIVMQDAKTVGGAELKFARKALGLRQVDLAERLQCNPQQLSRYENDDTIEMWLRLAMAGLLSMAERGEALETLGTAEAGADITIAA